MKDLCLKEMFGKTEKNKEMQNAFLCLTDSTLIYWCYNLPRAIFSIHDHWISMSWRKEFF